ITATLGGLELQFGVDVPLTGTHTIPTITGTHTSAISSTTTLTDTNVDFSSLGLITGTATLSNTTQGEGCTVTGVGTDNLTCSAGLSNSAAWEQGDAYSLVSPSSITLHDPTTDFVAWEIQTGATISNTTQDANCQITSVDVHTITCSAGLSDDEEWDEGDAYQVLAPGWARARFDGSVTLSHPGVSAIDNAETYSPDGFVAGLQELRSGPAGDDVSASISVGLDKSAAGYLGILEYSVGDIGNSSTTTATIPAALIAAMSSEPLTWELLTYPLTAMGDVLEENLDGDQWAEGLPLIGSEDLSAGADVPGVLDGLVLQLASLGDAIAGAADADEVPGIVQDVITFAITSTAGLTPTNSVNVTLDCGGACAPG
ncbi:MAG: hypothetical protein GY824_04640, partial [Delftia sp.]|nr:hypothetical protein [Delftia sp.]